MKILGYILAGGLALIGCNKDFDNTPYWQAPPIYEKINPHSKLFSEVFQDHPDIIDGDFLFRYRWDADFKRDSTGVAQMNDIKSEIGYNVSGYRTERDSLFLRVEDDSVKWSWDHNGDGSRDYIGKIDTSNQLVIIGFSDFHKFATDTITYSDAIQNIKFHIRENSQDVTDFQIKGINSFLDGQPYLVHNGVNVDAVITYKDKSEKVIIVNPNKSRSDIDKELQR